MSERLRGVIATRSCKVVRQKEIGSLCCSSLQPLSDEGRNSPGPRVASHTLDLEARHISAAVIMTRCRKQHQYEKGAVGIVAQQLIGQSNRIFM